MSLFSKFYNKELEDALVEIHESPQKGKIIGDIGTVGLKENYQEYDFYKGYEEDVRDSINRTHDIAWNLCEDTWIDIAKNREVWTDLVYELFHNAKDY